MAPLLTPLLDPFKHWTRYFWYSSSLSPTHIFSSLVMDRQTISSPVFDDNDGANNYINTHHFGLQRAMQGLENITTDLR